VVDGPTSVFSLPGRGRVGVGDGSTLQSVEDGLRHTVDLGQHIGVPEAQDPITHGIEASSPDGIQGLVVRLVVLPAIDFDDESAGQAGKVGDIPADWDLPSEPEACHLAAAKVIPELLLCVAHVSPEKAGLVLEYWVAQHDADDFADCVGFLQSLQKFHHPPPRPSPCGGGRRRAARLRGREKRGRGGRKR
jgi:hypothetical protein